jgi:DNA adenine methylase
VIYVDPPYLGDARGIRVPYRARHGGYQYEFDTEAEHSRLAEVLHETPATVLLSGYPSDLYEELYGDWYRTERTGIPNACSVQRGTSAPRVVESLWSNRPLRSQGRLGFVEEHCS